MARTRLIAIFAGYAVPDRILGCYSEPRQALAAILAAHVEPPTGSQLFYEDPDNVDPKMIQVRLAYAGEAIHRGRIMVDRGSVDTVLAELRKGEPT